MSDRIEYFDVLRGLAIIGVVAIHSSSPGLQFSHDSFSFNFTVIWRNLLNFSVPIFLAISGYFLARKKFETSHDYFSFLKKQIPRVYIPLLLWSFVWFGWSVFIQNQSPLDEAFKLVTFQSNGPYYFIALIIQFYILLPILSRLANNSGLILSILISLVTAGIIFYFRYYTDVNLPIIIYAGNFAAWLMFFVLGLYLGSSEKIEISNTLLALIILVLYAASLVESYVLIAHFDQVRDAVTAVKPSSLLYSFALIFFLFNNLNLIKSKLLKKLGEMSFGIYLTHMLALMVVGKLLSILYPPIQAFSPAHQFAVVVLVMLSCSVAILIAYKVLPPRINKLIGFK